MSENRIRNIEASHIGALIALGEAANLSHWSAQSYLDELKEPRSIMLRLESPENATIGFIVGRIVAAADDEHAVDADIYNIAVDQAAQGNGNGKLLLDGFVEKCHESFVRSVWLEVRESNGTAIKFYERNGFVAVTTRKHFYSNPTEHALLMRLDLVKK